MSFNAVALRFQIFFGPWREIAVAALLVLAGVKAIAITNRRWVTLRAASVTERER
jgi:hypothetical protein